MQIAELIGQFFCWELVVLWKVVQSQPPDTLNCYSCATANFDKFDAETKATFSKKVRKPIKVSNQCEKVSYLTGNQSNFVEECGVFCITLVLPLVGINGSQTEEESLIIRGCVADVLKTPNVIMAFQSQSITPPEEDEPPYCRENVEYRKLFGKAAANRNLTVCPCSLNMCNSKHFPRPYKEDHFATLFNIFCLAFAIIVLVVILFFLCIGRHIRKSSRMRAEEAVAELKDGQAVLLVKRNHYSTQSLLKNGTTLHFSTQQLNASRSQLGSSYLSYPNHSKNSLL